MRNKLVWGYHKKELWKKRGQLFYHPCIQFHCKTIAIYKCGVSLVLARRWKIGVPTTLRRAVCVYVQVFHSSIISCKCIITMLDWPTSRSEDRVNSWQEKQRDALMHGSFPCGPLYRTCMLIRQSHCHWPCPRSSCIVPRVRQAGLFNDGWPIFCLGDKPLAFFYSHLFFLRDRLHQPWSI